MIQLCIYDTVLQKHNKNWTQAPKEEERRSVIFPVWFIVEGFSVFQKN